MTTPMRSGLYSELQTNVGDSFKKRSDETLQMVEQADRLGFDVFMALEHHFFQTFSSSANPLALFAAAAQRTDRIRFRAMCHTLPVHNPMILAAEIAQTDLLTDGRLEAGVGRGHGWLYEPAGISPRESAGRYAESLDILVKAWTEESFSYQGEYYRVKDVSVVPKPMQKPYPKIFMTGTSGKSFEVAARNGWGIVVGGPAPAQIFVPGVEVYLETCARSGTTPDIGYVFTTYLSEDGASVRKELEPDLIQCYRNLQVPQGTIKTDAQKALLRESGYQFYAEGSLNAFATITYDEIFAGGMAFGGEPAAYLDKLAQIRKLIPFNELAIMADFAGLARWKVTRTLDLFAEQVMPHLGELA